MKPEMNLELYLAVFAEAGDELGLYLAAFANERMKRDMKLGLYLQTKE